ncbi:PASTA domain-containing protein [Nocardioides sp. zg-536]|uniref:non-specific serine/threonine protein kinase n=1 Tax=Nocardioides faecalis TaxID=2803858 RepID=A0A938Y8V6_9ACTN|nr:PASTA domain-containing protein [Nocardioides faecalis]QVI57604.1 PASTA domain-containing protein [Nocardioides faecalis]
MHRRVAVHDDRRARGDLAASAGDPARISDHQSGRLLDGRYRIGSRIARGGMASVYEATDTRLDRTVAVKIMHTGLGDASADAEESFARRFVREARAAARLSHPNVVAVYDQGRDDTGDGTIYLVMEYVPGHTLRDTITKEAPMSPERALAILEPVLSALASAHRAGLVHRDVKPENVLIADDGRIKVADFGLAKAISADTQHTTTNGVLIGTVSYLAPELVIEQKADARADVYAAGVILFELLTGTKPHTGESPIAVAYRHVHHDVPAPSSVVPGIPAYVDALVARATTRDPSLRPADAGVLLHHVRRVAHALHGGVREDDELVADLMPQARRGAEEGGAGLSDTKPEPVSSLWDGVPDWVRSEQPSDREATSVLQGPTAPRLAAGTTVEPATGTRTAGTRTAAASGPADDTNHPGHRGDDSTHSGAQRPRRRRRLVLLVVLAVLLASLGSAGYWFGWGRYTDTPSVVGLEQAAAVAKLEKAGLQAQVAEEVYSESTAKGVVIGTDPRPGARILPEDSVALTVSLGPERYDLPELAGLTLEEAESALGEVKMLVGRVTEQYSETVPKGQVVSSKPSYGTEAALDLPVNTAVSLVVSKGRKPIPVRDWTGRDADELAKNLTGRGLKVKTEDEFSEDVAKGEVIRQQPRSGNVYKGDTVTLVVSKGPPLVTVPGVRLSSTEDAVEKLEALGLVVKKRRASIYINGEVAWATDPAGGTRVRKGSTIVLYIV